MTLALLNSPATTQSPEPGLNFLIGAALIGIAFLLQKKAESRRD